MLKSVAIEDVYADPHKLDPFLATGVPAVVLKEGREVARLVPIQATEGKSQKPLPDSGKADFRARFLEMWGDDAFRSEIAVSEEFAKIRDDRPL